MVTAKDVIPLFSSACPSFDQKWETELNSDPEAAADVELLNYTHSRLFSEHVIELVGIGNESELPAAFAVIEQLLIEGDEYTSNLAYVGYIEDIRGATNDGPLEKKLHVFLGPETWKDWHTESSLMALDCGPYPTNCL